MQARLWAAQNGSSKWSRTKAPVRAGSKRWGGGAVHVPVRSEDWVRPALCEDALRLGRVLAGLVPDEPEVHGLLALMEIQESRMRARTATDGRPIPLLEQNRGRWDQLLIHRGLSSLARVEALGGAIGPYALQAAIAACHARAGSGADTDWPRIVALSRAFGVQVNQYAAYIEDDSLSEPALRMT
jgi:predicted RNA polymerase sigma factor